LAPAFDVNPNIDKAEHVLNIDDQDNRPDLQTALSTAAFYGLTAAQGLRIMSEVGQAVDAWRDVANQARISRADIELTALRLQCSRGLAQRLNVCRACVA
jgi:serine/threonine-protein kinase HipA